MRKKVFLSFLAIIMFLPFIKPADAAGTGKDINGIYKNDKFVLKIENFDQQTNSFSFTLNSVKGAGCDLALQGTAKRLKLSLSSPDAIRYDFISPGGTKYYFTVYSGEKTTVDIMRSGSGDNAANSCLPEKSISKLSFNGQE